MDKKSVQDYYAVFTRLNWRIKLSLALKVLSIVLMVSGFGGYNINEVKILVVLETLNWWLLWWGVNKQESIRVNHELWQAYIDNFVPVTFTGYVLGYGDVNGIQGHVMNRSTFWFFLPDSPEIMYDAPIANCFGEFTEHRIQEEMEQESNAV